MTSIVALGGGHGLSATLRALRTLDIEPIAVVGTGDDGGSSGRLREHLGVPPPGDLRMALVALVGDGSGSALWPRVLQHRFGGTGDVEGHALGNLLLVALWEETGDIVAGLDRLGRVLEARGRVLPNSIDPVVVAARVRTDDGVVDVVGQARLTATRGEIESLRLVPEDPRACPEAVSAIESASAIVFGPGSWYTSVLPHLLVPDIRNALERSSARRILVLNAAPQAGETEGFAAHAYLEAWDRLFPGIGLDVVLADPRSVADTARLAAAAGRVGAEVHLGQLLVVDGHAHHPDRLAAALGGALPAATR
ncbi:MAG: uridine diphosphate-N-acetylglucosamine-binding protein YvcK [Actinomycetota bacterium]